MKAVEEPGHLSMKAVEEPGPSPQKEVEEPGPSLLKEVETPGLSSSKDVNEPVEHLHDPDDPLSPEYVPKPAPPALPQERVKEEAIEESNGEAGGVPADDDDDHFDDDDDIDFDEEGGTNPLEPDVELGGDDEDDGEGEGSGAAMFSSGGHFLNGGGDDEEEGGGQDGATEDVDMSKVKSEAVDPDSGDESPKAGDEEEVEAPKPKKPKPKHSVKGTFACPMCPKVWGWPWELRRHVITHYKQVRQRTCEVCIVEMEPKFFTPLSLTERKGEGVKLQV